MSAWTKGPPIDLLCLDASKRFAAAFSPSTREDETLAYGLNPVAMRAGSPMCSVTPETVALWGEPDSGRFPAPNLQ